MERRIRGAGTRAGGLIHSSPNGLGGQSASRKANSGGISHLAVTNSLVAELNQINSPDRSLGFGPNYDNQHRPMNSRASPTAAPATARAPAYQGLDMKNPIPLNPGGRVRVIRGPLMGLTGVLVEQDVTSRWLLQADHADGVFVRTEHDTIELL